MVSLLSLKYFLVVAEKLNVTEAAKSLYITQQTLSNHIIQLEEHYGAKLFNRRPSLSLTTAGERMVEYASRIIRLERMMGAEMHDFAKKDGGSLIAGFSRLRAKCCFPTIWREYQQACPNVEVTLADTIHENALLHALKTHSVDLCINFSQNSSDQIRQREMTAESLFFVITKDRFHAHFGDRSAALVREFSENGISPESIVDFPLLLLPQSNIVRQKVNYFFEQIDVIPRPLFETGDSSMILDMCLADQGCSILSICNLLSPLESCEQRLQNAYFFPAKGISLKTYVTYPSDITPPYYLQKFIDICCATFQSYDRDMREKKALIEATWYPKEYSPAYVPSFL